MSMGFIIRHVVLDFLSLMEKLREMYKPSSINSPAELHMNRRLRSSLPLVPNQLEPSTEVRKRKQQLNSVRKTILTTSIVPGAPGTVDY